MRIGIEVTPELAQKMADAIDEADTAFVTINISSEGLSPQAQGALKKAWREIQSVMMELKGANSAYAHSVLQNRMEGVAP